MFFYDLNNVESSSLDNCLPNELCLKSLISVENVLLVAVNHKNNLLLFFINTSSTLKIN